MSSIRCWSLLALSLLLSGCIADNTMEGTLEEVGGASLVVDLTPTGGELRLISHTVKGLSKCLRFTGKAFLDGKDLEQVEAGNGLSLYIPGLGGPGACTPPTWRFDMPAATEGVNEFEVADSTGRLLYGVSALVAQRAVSFHAPLPGPVPGGPVTLEWSPATDQLADPINFDVFLDGVAIQPASEIAVRNGRIGFLLPSTVSPGPHRLSLDATPVHPGTAHCEPEPGRCTTWFVSELIPHPPEISITVQ
jgi:hypothetical protein